MMIATAALRVIVIEQDSGSPHNLTFLILPEADRGHLDDGAFECSIGLGISPSLVLA